MENEVVTKKTSYFTGTIGALIGGIIASIPWVLVYVYGNMMLSLLAVLIAAGEFYGYKICNGKIDKKLPAIIMALAIIIVTIITLLVIPAMLLQKESVNVTTDTIGNLYSYSEFNSAIIKDYFIALIFTILGASVVTANIKKQLLNGNETVELELSNNEKLMKQRQDAINEIKPIFQKYNAVNKETAMTKEEVLAEIESENAKTYFKYLESYSIIKKENGKFYYCEANEKNTKQKTSTGLILGIIIAVAVVITLASIPLTDKNVSIKTEGNDDVNFAILGDWNTLNEYSQDNGWTYYKYISNEDALYENVQSEDGTVDYTKYPARIGVAYDTEVSEESYNSIGDLEDILESYIKEELRPEEYNMEITTTQKGYDALKAKVKYTSEPKEVDYLYYIYKEDGKLAYITASTFNMDDEEQLEKDSEMILNSFVWNN